MQKNYKLSPERLAELKEELHYLKTVREREVADQIKEARSFGDLSENSEYDEAKNEQGRVFSRIAELEDILAHAEIIDTTSLDTEQVAMGCHVVVKDMGSGLDEEYYIVGSQEANPMEYRISDESPFGRSLIGCRRGDTVELDVPAGTLLYKVLDIHG